MDSKDKNYLSKETPLRDYYISYVNGSAWKLGKALLPRHPHFLIPAGVTNNTPFLLFGENNSADCGAIIFIPSQGHFCF